MPLSSGTKPRPSSGRAGEVEDAPVCLDRSHALCRRRVTDQCPLRSIGAERGEPIGFGAEHGQLVGVEGLEVRPPADTDAPDRAAVGDRHVAIDERIQRSERIQADTESAREHQHGQQRESGALREEPQRILEIAQSQHLRRSKRP
jgi:hypothetical protein